MNSKVESKIPMTVNKSFHIGNLSCLIFFCLCLICVLLCVLLTVNSIISIHSKSSINNFCNVNNILYNYINTNHQSWTDYFPSVYSPSSIDRLYFSIGENQQLVVYANYGTTESKSPIFYIPIESDGIGFGATQLGSAGLFFTPTGELPIYLIDEITMISDKIYCYKIE